MNYNKIGNLLFYFSKRFLKTSVLFLVLFLFLYIHPISAHAFNLTGQVTDQTQNPLQGVHISAIDSNTGLDGCETNTDTNGMYSCPSLLQGSNYYNIHAVPATSSGLQSTLDYYQYIPGNFVRNFVLTPIGSMVSISGRVYDLDGNGLNNQNIFFNLENQSPYGVTAITDSSGNYATQLVPTTSGFYQIFSSGTTPP